MLKTPSFAPSDATFTKMERMRGEKFYFNFFCGFFLKALKFSVSVLVAYFSDFLSIAPFTWKLSARASTGSGRKT